MQFTKNETNEELRRFFELAVAHDESLPMFSPYLDAAWHRMLDTPNQYELFCVQSCGQRLEHQRDAGVGNIDWILAYEERFGKLSPAWFTDVDGTLREDNLREYERTGHVRASWGCTPVIEKHKSDTSDPPKEDEKRDRSDANDK